MHPKVEIIIKPDIKAAATPPKVDEAIDEPEDVAVEEEPAEKAYVPKVKVQKVKKAYFKPKSDYRKIQKARVAIQKRNAKRYEPVYVVKRPIYKKRVAVYKPAKRIACAGTWRNGRCIIKPKYARVKYVKPKYQAPPKPKKVYQFDDSQGSSGGGGGGGGGGNTGSW